jgi:DNA-directed RNA polymerase subunit RPC12/RpoP
MAAGLIFYWCFACGVEISDYDEQTGRYRKCEKCERGAVKDLEQ